MWYNGRGEGFIWGAETQQLNVNNKYLAQSITELSYFFNRGVNTPISHASIVNVVNMVGGLNNTCQEGLLGLPLQLL